MIPRFITRLASSLGIIIFIFCSARAEKTDDYNYRVAIMDDFTIYDNKARQIYDEGRLDLLFDPPEWKLYDDDLEILESEKFSAKVQCLKPTETARIWHNFYQGINGVSHFTSLCFKIEIVAPKGVEFKSDFPTNLELGQNTYIGSNLTGPELPEYNNYHRAGVLYEYKSSDPDVVAVDYDRLLNRPNVRIYAKSIGNATITVTAKAYNADYNNSYIIGSDSRTIEVVEPASCDSILFYNDPVFIKRPADTEQSLKVINYVKVSPASSFYGITTSIFHGQEEIIHSILTDYLETEEPGVYKIRFYMPYAEEATAVMRAYNGVEGQFRIIVYDPAESIILDKTSAELSVGEDIQLSATVLPGNATYKNLTWTSEDESIATVSNTGVVKALKKGDVRITAKSEVDDISAYCDITVIQPIEAIYLSKSKINIKPGEFETLTAYVSPENANNKTLNWKSMNEQVAKVENGTVMGISTGDTRVQAIAADGSSVFAECVVEVTDLSGLDDILMGKNICVKIFNLQGMLVYEGNYSEANLAPDYYIVVCNGKNIKVKIK